MEKKRLFYIDNLRLLIIIFVVIQHLAVTYSSMGSWYYMDGRPLGVVSTAAFGFYQSFTQGYFMGFLFLLAGYFIPGSYDKKGFGNYLKDRFIRLMIPALFYMLVIHPFILYFQLGVYWISPTPGFFEYYGGYVTSTSVLEGSGPLWFAIALFIFSAVYGLFRLVRKPMPRWQSVSPRTTNIFRWRLLIGAFAFLIRTVQPIGTSVLNMQLCYFAQYIVLFIVGIVAYRSDLFSKISLKSGKRWLFAAIVPGFIVWSAIMVFCGALEGNENYNGGFTWESAAYALWEAFTAVAVSTGLIAIFREKRNQQNMLIKTMSDNAFAVYVFHAPIIVAVAQLFAPLEWLPIFKFALLIVICIPLCFAATHFIFRRIPLLKKIL
jgi:fucose 4-O-acetylase-like acetyltransferase